MIAHAAEVIGKKQKKFKNFLQKENKVNKKFEKFEEKETAGNYVPSLPSKQVYHETNTCFVASSIAMLQTALAFVEPEKRTVDENCLYNLLRRVCDSGYKSDQQTIFLVNMQCIIFNQALGLNKRNKKLFLMNEPIVGIFDPRLDIRELINYNIGLLEYVNKNWGWTNITTQINEAKRLLNEFQSTLEIKQVHLLFHLLSTKNYGKDDKDDKDDKRRWKYYLGSSFEEKNGKMSLQAEDYNIKNLSEIMKKEFDADTTTIKRELIFTGLNDSDKIVESLIMFRNTLIDLIVNINDVFIDAVEAIGWNNAPYLFDLSALLNPHAIYIHLYDEKEPIIGLNKMKIRIGWNIDGKNIAVHDFIKAICFDDSKQLQDYAVFGYIFKSKRTYKSLGTSNECKFDIQNILYDYNPNDEETVRPEKTCPLFTSFEKFNQLQQSYRIAAEIYKSGDHWMTAVHLTEEMRNKMKEKKLKSCLKLQIFSQMKNIADIKQSNSLGANFWEEINFNPNDEHMYDDEYYADLKKLSKTDTNSNIIILDDNSDDVYFYKRYDDRKRKKGTYRVFEYKERECEDPRFKRVEQKHHKCDTNKKFCLIVPTETIYKYHMKLYGGKIIKRAFTLLLAIILLIVLVIVCVYVCKRFEIFDYKSEPPI